MESIFFPKPKKIFTDILYWILFLENFSYAIIKLYLILIIQTQNSNCKWEKTLCDTQMMFVHI